MMGAMNDLYEQDFYAWTQATATLIRQQKWHEINWEQVAEELEALGTRERRELRRRLEVLILHLLKWKCQPEHQSRSWRSTILEQRRQLADLLDDNRSLRPHVPELVARVYPHARRRALEETGLFEGAMLEDCPFTPDRILEADYWPES